MFFNRKGKEIPEKKLRDWQKNYKVDKIVDVAKNANTISRLRAIEVLQEINMSQVKTQLLMLLDDQVPSIALKAADALESMGIVADERELVKACREKHSKAV